MITTPLLPSSQPVVGCFGGGLDSTTLMAIDSDRSRAAAYLGVTESHLADVFPSPDVWLFSDTGAEHAGTYAHIEWIKQICANLVIVRRDGENIAEWCTRLGIVPLMPGGSHICSLKFKGEVMQKWVKAHTSAPATWIIGIEADEGKRAKRFQKPRNDAGTYLYPLLELGITRDACEGILAHLGWPTPIKSSCTFCPFKSEAELRWMYRNDHQAWDQCQEIESAFEAMSAVKNQAWLDAGQPLNKGGRAPRGMWRKNSWAEGARLFARKVNGQQLSMQEWAEIFEAERELINLVEVI